MILKLIGLAILGILSISGFVALLLLFLSWYLSSRSFNSRVSPFRTRQEVNELDNPLWLSDAKEFIRKLQISRTKIRDYLADGLRDSKVILVELDGKRTHVEFHHLEKSDGDDDDSDGFEWWYKDWCKPTPPGVTPRLRREARERVRAITTIVRMMFPKETSVWGKEDW